MSFGGQTPTIIVLKEGMGNYASPLLSSPLTVPYYRLELHTDNL